MIPTFGKTVHRHTYVHVSCLELLEPEQRILALAAAQQSGLQPGEHFNVLRFESDLKRIALLSYPEFFEAPYPELKQSWVVDLEKGKSATALTRTPLIRQFCIVKNSCYPKIILALRSLQALRRQPNQLDFSMIRLALDFVSNGISSFEIKATG